jgi:DinB superfamily
MTMQTEPPSWSVRLLLELDAADQRATTLATALSPEQLNWKPSESEWSVGQCLDHLCVVNDVYLPPIASSLAGRPSETVPEITPGWFGRWFIRNYIEPSPATKRAKAPRKIAPASQVDGFMLERFLTGNRNVRDLIRRAANYDVNRIRFTNPFVYLIRFTVGTGLEIIVRHQRRHLLQAERVKARPGFPQPAR